MAYNDFDAVDSGTLEHLYGVTYLDVTFFAVGANGTMVKSDDGSSWSDVALTGTDDLNAITSYLTTGVAVGDAGFIVYSTDSGATWIERTDASGVNFTGVATDGTRWVFTAENGELYYTDDLSLDATLCSYDVTPDGSLNFTSVAYGSVGGEDVWAAVGDDGMYYTSSDGETWTQQGSFSGDMNAVDFLDDYFVYAGDGQYLSYNESGGEAYDYAGFDPLSEDYRGSSFCVLSGYVLLVGTTEWNSTTSEWDYYQRRIRWTAPNTYNDFSGVGSGVADLPGDGKILDIRRLGTQAVLFETNRLGLISPYGDASNPWQYTPLDDSVPTISNPVVAKESCYYVAADGLIYTVSPGGVLDSMNTPFDLTKFDDWDDTGPVWMDYSQKLQALLIFKPSSPYYVHIVELDSGAYTSFGIPTWGAYTPASAYSLNGSDDGVYIGYTTTAGESTLKHAKLLFQTAQTGSDEPISGTTSKWYAIFETGELYLVPEGAREAVQEIILRTYCDGTTNPDAIVQVRSLEDDSWHGSISSIGTITVDTTTCTGVSTVWSNKIAAGDDVEDTFTTPWLAAQGGFYTEVGDVYTAITPTVNSAYEVTLSAALATGTDLYQFTNNEPTVQAAAGDYIETTEGFHRVTSFDTAFDATLSSYLSAGSDATATHHHAEAIPNGEAEVKFSMRGLCEGLRIRVYIIPRSDGDATIIKLTGMAVGYTPSSTKRVE